MSPRYLCVYQSFVVWQGIARLEAREHLRYLFNNDRAMDKPRRFFSSRYSNNTLPADLQRVPQKKSRSLGSVSTSIDMQTIFSHIFIKFVKAYEHLASTKNPLSLHSILDT
jgi:hypothetical protein